jgi:hypothetical protein
MPLHVHFLEDFNSGPTILLMGGSQDFSRLANLIEARRAGNLSDLLATSGQSSIALTLAYGVCGRVTHSGKDFYWILSDREATEFIALLRSLAENAAPGHQYLDTGSGEIEVVASKDEFDPRTFEV